MIKELNSLKAILAILVFICHSMGLPGLGGFAVSLFFILSGFGLSSGYQASIKSGTFNTRNFYLRRIKKIYPLHILFCLLAVIISYHSGNKIPIWKLIINLSLLQSWFPDISVYYSCNPTSWFLSVLLFCYAIFPFLSKLFSKKKTYFYILFAIYGFSILTLAHIVANKSLEYAYFICPLVRVLDFISGMILYDLYKTGNLSLKITIPLNNGHLSLLIIIVLIIFSAFVPWAYSRYSVFFMVIGIFILTLIISITDNSNIPVLSNDFFCSLGKYSFPFYICHGVCINFCKLFLEEESFVFILSSFALSASITYLISRIHFNKQ